MTPLARLLVFSALVFSAGLAQAQDFTASPFTPPEIPTPKLGVDQDLVIMKSGEVLIGALKSYWDGKLKFKSKGADAVLELKLDEVETLYSPSNYTWVTTDLVEHVGAGKLDGVAIALQTSEGEHAFAREELLRILPGVPSESQYWTAHLHLGVTATTGNTQQVTGLAKVDIRRETSISRLDLGYRGTYGQAQGEESAKSHEGILELRVFLSRRFYLIPALGRVLYDKFQNIRLRATAGAGAGYFLVRDTGVEWALEGGASYTYTEQRRSPPGDSRTRTDAHVRVATRVEWDITDTVNFTGNYEILIGASDIESTLHQAEATLKIELYEDLNLAMSVIWKRVERPGLLLDGSRLHHDDAKFSLGLTLDL